MSSKNGNNKNPHKVPFPLAPFDFNHDGKLSTWENWMAYQSYRSWVDRHQGNASGHTRGILPPLGGSAPSQWDNAAEGPDYDVYPEDFDTEEEYNEALEEAKYAWREDYQYDELYGLDPDDFETEEDFQEALEEVKYAWREEYRYKDLHGLDPDDFETEADFLEALEMVPPAAPAPPLFTGLDNLRQEDFPNQRTYEAACRRKDLLKGTAYLPSDTTLEEELAKCDWLLAQKDPAARYLSLKDGFLLALAVKEAFSLPATVPVGDGEADLHDLLLEWAEENPAQAVQGWLWAARTFLPWASYGRNLPYHLSWQILSSMNDYAPPFQDLAAEALGGDLELCQLLLHQARFFPQDVEDLVCRAIQREDFPAARTLFQTTLSYPQAKSQQLGDFVQSVLRKCCRSEDLEPIEAFLRELLPLVAQQDNKRLQRLLPQWREVAETHIQNLESYGEKYRYTRRFAWRKPYADSPLQGLDPLRYQTEEAYLAAARDRQYGWRGRQVPAFGLDPANYETLADYQAAVTAAQQQAVAQTSPTPAEEDQTIYRFCGVRFPRQRTLYYYRTEDDTLTIGDKVLAPVSGQGKASVVEVATVELHQRDTAPYPVDQAKFLLGRAPEKAP